MHKALLSVLYCNQRQETSRKAALHLFTESINNHLVYSVTWGIGKSKQIFSKAAGVQLPIIAFRWHHIPSDNHINHDQYDVGGKGCLE